MCIYLELCQEATSGEVFLLASAALANITFFDTIACEMLLQLDAMNILIAACGDKQRVDSPYSRDQVSEYTFIYCYRMGWGNLFQPEAHIFFRAMFSGPWLSDVSTVLQLLDGRHQIPLLCNNTPHGRFSEHVTISCNSAKISDTM